MIFKDFVRCMQEALAKDPTLGDLFVVSTDDQCAHNELNGYVLREAVDGWPTEYCIDETLPEGATEFVRIS